MIQDYEFALIELDEAETLRFRTDPAYQQQVEGVARDMADDTDRTVTIHGNNGVELEHVSAE